MSRKFLNIGQHGYYGDFYKCEEEIFRADNLEIATKIAFNKYLYNFDRLYRSCRLTAIEPGRFNVEIDNHSKNGSILNSHTISKTVEYHGPANMFEADYIQDQSTNPKFRELLSAMNKMVKEGHPSVRISKRTGRVIFCIGFPRYHSDGEWWSSENSYLDTNPKYAAEQIEFALADDETRKQIINHNWGAANESK